MDLILVVAKYKDLVFSAIRLDQAFGHRPSHWYIQFLDFCELEDSDFIEKFSKFFQQSEYLYQIFESKTNPLSEDIKFEIEVMIQEPLMQKNIREYNLKKLL
jgi:hypothetical protein